MKDTWLDIYHNGLLIDHISVRDKAQANEIIQMIDKHIMSFENSKDVVNDWPRLCLFR